MTAKVVFAMHLLYLLEVTAEVVSACEDEYGCSVSRSVTEHG